MTPFGLLMPGRIRFGRGEAAHAPDQIAAFGPRGVVVHGGSPARSAWLVSALRDRAEVLALSCPGEPDLAAVTTATAEARRFRPDWVAAIGGGSAIDLGKAVAALVPAGSPVTDHLEVVGRGLPLPAAPLPFVALPTTAGTGAEATRNAVIGLPEHGRKVSLRDDRMMPRLAIVDPALTDHSPRAVTLASGLDAVVQVIEPYVSNRANPFTDALALPAIGQGLAALRRLMEHEDAAARDAMAWVSLSGGIALTNAGLGAVHGLAGVIGGVTTAPHGLICGRLIGPVLRANLEQAEGDTAARLARVCSAISRQLGGTEDSAPETLLHWVTAQDLKPLQTFGLSPEDQDRVAGLASASSSMKGNPVPLTAGRLAKVLQAEAG